MIEVEIHLQETSQSFTHKNVIQTYTKGPMYCLLVKVEGSDNKVIKYPLCTIFRVVEQY